MIADCKVNVEGVKYGIKIIKKGKGLFNNVSAKPKAVACPNRGNFVFYIDEYEQFGDYTGY